MIIDCHAHVTAPSKLLAHKGALLSHHGHGIRRRPKMSDDELLAALNVKQVFEMGHLDYLDKLGTDIQIVSPRPFQMMHSEKPGKLVHWFTEEVNDVIYRQTQLLKGRFYGIGGLPQVAGDPIEVALPELDRMVKELDFRGCLINPDPFENSGQEAPPLGDEYWYPLYQKLCDLDVPGYIHATTSRSARTSYSVHLINEETIAVLGLINSRVFTDFPNLKIVVSHGGGAIPYQLGRFATKQMRSKGTPFREQLRQLYFDTVLYSQDALELLIKTVGADNCVFGSECPGSGSVFDDELGHFHDDIGTKIRAIDWLAEDDRDKIFFGNAKALFKIP